MEDRFSLNIFGISYILNPIGSPLKPENVPLPSIARNNNVGCQTQSECKLSWCNSRTPVNIIHSSSIKYVVLFTIHVTRWIPPSAWAMTNIQSRETITVVGKHCGRPFNESIDFMCSLSQSVISSLSCWTIVYSGRLNVRFVSNVINPNLAINDPRINCYH